jgi:DNA polymerase IIIc chi subunit
MTEVAFHFNATDKLEYACRLLRKAVASSAQVVVSGGDQQIKALDTALWSFSSASFIPHCVFDDKEHTLAHSPVVLVEFDHQRPANYRPAGIDPQAPNREHIHVVVRTPNGNDYGKDLLRQHLLAHPH